MVMIFKNGLENSIQLQTLVDYTIFSLDLRWTGRHTNHTFYLQKSD